MLSYAFSRLATVTYSTKRNAVGANQVTKAVTNLSNLLGTPRVPANVETMDQYRIQSPRQHYVIYFEGSPDVLQGDFIVVDGVDMPVRGAGQWPSNNAFLEVLVEEIK